MLANRPGGAAAAAAPSSAVALRREIVQADDEKLGKIIAYVDQVGAAEINRALLDTLRGRVALLRPVRPLQLSRLLFIPLDPLVVSPAKWRPGSPRIPRTALAPLFSLVVRQIGADIAALNGMVEGQTTQSDAAIAQAGAALWPRAAAILRAANPPPEWEQTRLPEPLFSPMARAVAAVLQRGSDLLRLARNAQKRDTSDDLTLASSIMAHLADETPEGAAIVIQLISLHAPQALVHVRRLVSAIRDAPESITLHRALGHGLDHCLSYVECEADCVRKIARGSIRDATGEIQVVAQVLTAIDQDLSAALHRGRVRALREELATARPARFRNGIQEDLIRALAALKQPASSTEQKQMEASARGLRALEGAARQFGHSVGYDQQLLHAADTVRNAFAAGTISLPRACRLLEILSGPEAAVALYRRAPAVPQAAS